MNHPVLVSIFLGLAVAAVLGGCAGIMTMRGAAARLHFVNAATLIAPPLVMAAVLTEEGFSEAGLTAILIVAVLLIQGPVVAHVIGRAIHSHERLPVREERKPSQ